jgi:hypothetical protein
MGGLKSAFKSIKRFVKKNSKEIATIAGLFIPGVGPALGAGIGRGIGGLAEGEDLGEAAMAGAQIWAGGKMLGGAGFGFDPQASLGNKFSFGVGGVDPSSSGLGGFFENIGASAAQPFTKATLNTMPLGESFANLNMMQKAGAGLIGATGLNSLSGGKLFGGDEEPATMPGPIDQSGYLQQGLTPAQLSDVYSTGGTQTGIAGSMPSLAQNYDYDPINSSIAELLKQQDEYELEFPEFARIGMRDGGNVNMLQAIQLGGTDKFGPQLPSIKQPSFGGARRGAQGGDLMSVLNPIGDYIQDRINADEIGPTINEFAQTIESRFPSSDQGGGGGNMMQPYPSIGRLPSMGRPMPINNIGGNFLNKIEPLPVPGMLQPISPDGRDTDGRSGLQDNGLQESLRNAENQDIAQPMMGIQPTVARLADGGPVPEVDLRDGGGDIVDENGSGDEDTVPALLADGEFVMTKQAVAGMGNGDHDQGIAQLYAMMNMNENKAQQMGIGRA